MASTYVNDLRLNEMATGDQSGSWGTVTNTNLELIGEAFSYGTENITTNADTHTTTIADGATAPGRSMFLKYTGTLDSACTITIGPNTVNKMWFIENATTGSQNIIISQGSGANVTIAAGQTKAVYGNGAGAGAAVVDAFAALDVGSLAIAGTLVTSTAAEINILDGVTATAAEINYVDGVTSNVQTQINAKVAKAGDTMTGNLSFGTNNKATFGATAGGDLQIYHDGSSSIIADVGTGNLQLRANDFQLLDAGSTKNIIRGYDATGAVGLHYGGGEKLITTATGIDVTGNATFADGGKAVFGASSDLEIYHDGTQSFITDQGPGSLNILSSQVALNNVANTENMLTAAENGAVTLFYDNAQRLATSATGITVTGTINSGDLRGEAWLIGRDTNDYISVNTTEIDFVLDGNTDMRLENDGDLHVDGNVIAYSTTISDERLKTDIVKIDGALDKIAQLNGYTFTYIADGKKSAGVIAQEVQKVLPSAIIERKLPLKMGDDDETEYMTVQYDQLMGILIEAIKELKEEVAALKGK